jgi:hypothetical protein
MIKMKNKDILSKYGLEDDEMEIGLKEETKGNDIIDKNTVKQAVEEGIKMASERTPEENEKMKQLVTVLESIRSSLENMEEDSNNVEISKASINAVLTSNNLEPLEDSDTVSITKENLKIRIKEIKKTLI